MILSSRALRRAVRAMPLALLLILILGLGLSLSGCASVPKEVYLIEPSSKLEYSPEIYFRSSGPVLRDIAAGFGEKELLRLSKTLGQEGKAGSGEGRDGGRLDLSSMNDILKRSRTVGCGIRGLGTNSLKMEAVLVGDFMPISLRLGLAFDGSWSRMDDGGYRSVNYPLYLRAPLPGIVQLSSEAKGPTSLAALPPPYPAAFDEISKSDLFISADGQAALRSLPLPMESAALPLRAIAMAGSYTEAFLTGKSPASPRTAVYSLEVRILMKDEASARSYRPIVRFLWAAAAGKFFGEGSPAGALVPVQEKDSYVIRGIELTSEEFRRIIGTVILGG
jgi:hypothetical protein